jgi:hypothetical protein
VPAGFGLALAVHVSISVVATTIAIERPKTAAKASEGATTRGILEAEKFLMRRVRTFESTKLPVTVVGESPTGFQPGNPD